MQKAPPKTATSRYTEVAPNAHRTMSALREMGYDSFASVADLIDNSIDAGATRVDVNVREVGKKALVIDVVDDGKGMDAKTLAEALRLGSDTDHTDPHKRLGKFGMGLVTASISMARSVWVVTREDKKQAFEADFDLGTIERENKFVIALKPAGPKAVELIGDHGTLVRLSQIDRINDTNVARFAATLRTKLGQVYRHFLAKGVTIAVNNRKVERYDPLMLEHPATEVILDTTLDLGDGTRGTLKVVELPELGQAGDAENNIFPDNSGFYVVRNGREIIAADTFGFYKKHHSYSHFRAELAYEGSTTVLHEDIKKASIHPDDRLRDKLRGLTEKLIAQSGRRGRDRAEAAPVKLSHKSAEAAINSRLSLMVNGPSRNALQAVQEAAGATPPPDAPIGGKKRGRPSKAEAEAKAKAAKEEADKPAPLAPKQQPPKVEFIEVDAGEKGRFFTAEQKNGNITISYNTRHPLVRLVADSKQKQSAAVLDMVAFSLAKAEIDVPEGTKLVNRTCDYLSLLASPAVTQEGTGRAK
jgi:hypothetical protein